MYILGTDEAGYGPNLGPLVVSVSAWTAPADLSGTEFYKRLFPVVLQDCNKKELKTNPGSFLLDDSKKLYHGRKSVGLKHLEYALLTALRSLHRIGTDVTFEELVRSCELRVASCENRSERREARNEKNQYTQHTAHCTLHTAHCSRNSQLNYESPALFPLPIDADKSYLDETTACFERIQKESGIQLTDLRSDIVFPARFNEGCDRWGNKSTLLSKTTLNLLKSVLYSCPEETIVWCDKHGGRNFYSTLLEEEFFEKPCSPQTISKEKDSPDFSQLSLFEQPCSESSPVTILEESESISSYEFTWEGYKRTVHFQAKGDCSPPGALASIACKYLRELFMNQLNEYWQEKVPNLVPTAGYPVDAKRFLEKIQSKIDFPMDWLWRKK